MAQRKTPYDLALLHYLIRMGRPHERGKISKKVTAQFLEAHPEWEDWDAGEALPEGWVMKYPTAITYEAA